MNMDVKFEEISRTFKSRFGEVQTMDSFSPIVAVEDIVGGHRVTITDKNGAKTFDVMDGKDGAGGADWNAVEGESGHILNRTHYAIPPAIDITWDGDKTNRPYMQIAENVYFVKVSDDIYTEDKIMNATVCVTLTDGTEAKYVVEEIYTGSGAFGTDDLLVCYDIDAWIKSIGVPESVIFNGPLTNGIYFISDDVSGYLSSLVGAEMVIKIDKKYLPDISYNDLTDKPTIPTSYNDLTDKPTIPTSYNDLTDKPCWVEGERKSIVSASVKTMLVMGNSTGTSSVLMSANKRLIAGKTYGFSIGSVEYSGVCETTTNAKGYDTCTIRDINYDVSGAMVTIDYTTSTYNAATLSVAYKGAATTVDVRIYIDETTIHTLSEQYIPDTIARTSDIPKVPDSIPNPTTAQVGQTITVKTVDESGKPTEWETVDIVSKVIAALPIYDGEVVAV